MIQTSRAPTFATSIVVTFIVLAACKVGQAVLEPAVFAAFIVIIALPFQNSLKAKIGKAPALALTIVVTAAVVLGLLSLTVWSGYQIAEWTRQNVDRIQESLLSTTSWLEDHDIFVFSMVADHFDRAALLELLRTAAIRANTILAFALVVLVYVILGLSEAEFLRSRVAALPSRDLSDRLIAGGARIGAKFRAYIFVRTLASVATGLSVWGFTRFMGMELAAAWGIMTYSLNYLPYIGSFVGVVLPTAFAFLQFGSVEPTLLTFIGLLGINFVIGSVVEPIVSGSALSISPPLVLFSISVWTYIWGVLGAFLGVPLTIAALALCEQFPSARWVSDLLAGGPGKPRPAAQERRDDRLAS